MAIGQHPYAEASGDTNNAFRLLEKIVKEPSPTLEQHDQFSTSISDFVDKSLHVSEIEFISSKIEIG